ncbi:hypothetical protein [Silvanigrella aquatica]|uniref:Uncharacterized protein n=1 Tax=Silvanigrella aquatica TaxID=1915309 RepID=A0A1L4CXA9_9BACT|nr:hypothetical protein [Silvanigrella aquatica]APJ02585.1 hypothetical protein AXG55_01005 [Silvanigrella aquatica]
MFFADYSEIEEFLERLHHTPAIYSSAPTPNIAINNDLNKLGIDAMKLSSDFANAKLKIEDKDMNRESAERTRNS